MKLTLFLLALVTAQVLGLHPPIDPEDEVRAPIRPDPSTIAGCTGNDAIANCDKCDNPSLQCNECMDRYYRTLDWMRCLPCSSNCMECTDSNTDDVTECLKCDDSYYLMEDKKCDKCVGHCSTCTMADQCNACDASYHMLDTAAGSQRKCLTCTTRCVRCDDSGSTSCRECEAGYYLTTAAPSSCSVCASGCAECTDGTSCDRCDTGKTWDSAANMCIACIANCDVCDTDAGCTKCDTGYSLASDKSVCYDCSNCDGCPETGGCTKCNYGYILQSKECYTCPQVDDVTVCTDCQRADDTRARFFDAVNDVCLYCPENSVSCTSLTSVTCMDGMYFNNPSCAACDPSCLTCSAGTASSCTTCVDGKFNNGGTCTACGTTNCATCSALNTCTECVSGFYLDPNDSDNCIACPSSDADLDKSADACQICGSSDSEGMVMDATMRCTGSCPTDCLLCTDATSCDMCAVSYTWDSVTTACVAGGASDLYVDSAGNNVQCSMGNRWNSTDCDFYLSDGTTSTSLSAVYEMDNSDNIQYCVQATPTVTGAFITDCTFDGSKDANGHYGASDTLIGCEFGYTLDTAGTSCIACTSSYTYTADTCGHCNADESAGTGSFWEGTCTACGTDCLACTKTGGSTPVCTSCVDGKYADTTCKDVTCESVDTSAECTECATETQGTNWQSGTCHTCPENCESCTTSTTCLQCLKGFSYNSAINKCVDCDFQDSTECSTCGVSTGTPYGRYYDSEDLECKQCPDGCMTCNSDTECTTCFSTYYMDSGNLCQPCPASSSITDSAMCDTCMGASYYWDDTASSCNACPTNCDDCSQASTCTTCAAGYYFDPADTTKCQRCITSCSECSLTDPCITCNSGKYYDGSACTNCPSDCAVCDTKSGCTTCNSGFYLVSGSPTGTCSSCSSAITHCLTCSSASICDNCGTGRYFKADTTECASCIDNCDHCVDGTTCATCSSGYCLDEAAQVCRSTSSTSCHTCTLNNEDEVTCLSCPAYYHLEICTACEKSNCIKCDADKAECETCAGGYFLEGISCTQCPGGVNCLECSNADSCSKCRTGYFSDVAARTCTACPSGCATCTSADTCAQCANSNAFFDTDANRCTNCLSGCKSCDKVDECKECFDGYAEIKTDGVITECRACPMGCEECSLSGEELVCSECYDGYFMKSDLTCEMCSVSFPMCSECEDDNNNDQIDQGECEECSAGTLKDDESACLACSTISGCGDCEDLPMLCLECSADFFPTRDLEECHPGCYTCNSQDHEHCEDNVAQNNTVIEACPGLGTTASCEVVRYEDSSGMTDVYFERYCAKNNTCPEPESEICQTAQGDMTKEECKICCTDNLCNTQTPIGENSGVTSINYQVSLVTILITLTIGVLNSM